ncbi:alkylation response protein AidB-like acyl-CoA dehydrogenase [Novosphingobium kunmingense]|uniref:Alkylation response protein AidB-like acyl-CoA dehydrogenase n=1 Tax=Novosphingobium kunmingense TaxID=1211806 RepID=A0A2N0H5Y1_9SPHN|nr:acyl-CoA dehydrogenase family protein [Novosphingobium kunmingense]PKB14334.1 alkylation response protein AidB-like acyl-CoA dehydrogenase [Novosphingobium kunmingense]
MDIQFSSEEQRFREECRDWLNANVPAERRPMDAEAAIGFDKVWQRRLFDAGWAGINWPRDYGGRGLSIVQQVIWLEEYARAHAPWIGANFVGVNHGGPTLILNASEAQKTYHLPRILRGDSIWCQGFSEPGAGSDLAGIRTRGKIEGDELVINGTKIWTSFAHVADWQELVLRTEEGSQRHKGLSWVICPMRAPGIEIRPIRKMSGQVEFAQVFYDDVRIPLENVVGGLGNGWKVAMSTLSFERGTGFIADQVKQSQEIEDLLARARSSGALRDDRIAEQLAQMRVEVAALRAMTYRNISEVVRTGQPGPEASVIRLFTSELGQRLERMALLLAGEEILDFRYGDDDLVADYLRGFAATIAGGTAQIQRDIIGERLLGLPKSR